VVPDGSWGVPVRFRTVIGSTKSATFCNKVEWSLHLDEDTENEDGPRVDLMIQTRVIRSKQSLPLLLLYLPVVDHEYFGDMRWPYMGTKCWSKTPRDAEGRSGTQ
jgi:hypothetical protein